MTKQEKQRIDKFKRKQPNKLKRPKKIITNENQ